MDAASKKWVIENSDNGVVTTHSVTEYGIHRSVLQEMVSEGDLIQYSRGIYVLSDQIEDEYYILQQKYKRGIFSHATALYLLGYSERVPLSFHMTFPSQYNSQSLKNENIIVTRVIQDFYELGVSLITTPFGNKVLSYDLERSLCDVLRNSEEDIQVIQYAMKKYAGSKDRDINKLMEYATKLRVAPKVKKYMEVLL